MFKFNLKTFNISLKIHRRGKRYLTQNFSKWNNFKTEQNNFKQSTNSKKAVLIPGDGIGPEISNSVVQIFKETKIPIEWEVIPVTADSGVNQTVIDAVMNTKVALKGPLATPIGSGHTSLNLALRKTFNLYANVRPCVSIPGFKTLYEDVDLCVIRENTEGEYSGIEFQPVPNKIAESVKIITEEASTRIANYAFQYAFHHKRKKVTAVHKANIMKLSDGLFIKSCRKVAARWPTIVYEEMLLDVASLYITQKPNKLDVMVLPNLYGDIISDMCAGLIGGLGLTPSGNIGDEVAIFESVHGTAPDIAGQNKANPTALLLSSCMMLKHIGMNEYANRLQNAILNVVKEGKVLTGDLGGKASTTEYTNEIIRKIKENI
jgi:isocitrate dehydrogenase (NAD+)